MLRAIVDARSLIALAIAAGVGAMGVREFPVRLDEPFLAAIHASRPDVFQLLAHGYALLWFSTPFCVASLFGSLLTIVFYRATQTSRFGSLPPYPEPEERPAPC